MKIFKRLFVFLFLGIISISLISQDGGIGQWSDHLPFNNFSAVTEAGNKIYGATPYALLVYNLDDQSIERFTKINGLSDIGISDIKYSIEQQTVVLAYTNTNIDLFKGNTIINIPDIKRKQILGNKVINRVSFKDEYAYLSCGFGIVVLDLAKEEIHDTWYIGPQGSHINVFDFTHNDTAFFAATADGIFTANVNSPNLADFASWSKMGSAPYPNNTYNIVEFYGDKLFANLLKDESIENDITYYFDGNDWTIMLPENTSDIKNIEAGNGKLSVALAYNVRIYNSALEEDMRVYSYFPGDPNVNDAIYCASGDVWIADLRSGLVKSLAGGWQSMKINPGGPYSSDVFSMTAAENYIWVAAGGYTSTWAPLFKQDGTFRYYNNDWTTFNNRTNSSFSGIYDIVTIAVNPTNVNEAYLGVFRNEIGVIRMDGDEVTDLYTEENSELQKWEAANSIALVGLGFDSKGSLWSLCSGAEKLLAEKKSDGSWASYSLGGSASAVDCSDLMVDSYDQKWILFRHSNSNPNEMAVYNENNPPADRLRPLSTGTGAGNIPGSTVFSMAQDLDGEVWIGTDEGIGIFYSPSDILTSSDYDCVRPLVNFDGYVQYLLETEIVTAIAIDGDNRKWIGTERSGVFFLSADGTEQINHFTQDNSPLFSNQIIDITISSAGEIFIGTASGIISYKGTASTPTESFSDVYAYPNPVKDGYDGLIAVKGLLENSDIKITDISGTLIYSTRSEGGQAVWNGKNFDGRKARPGVYLVFASNEDGSEKMVTKILIIN